MNPTKRPVQKTARLMDIAHPAPIPSSMNDSLKTTYVGNIPVQQQVGQAPIKEDEELDKIMKAVDKEMKAGDKKPAKKHFFSKKPKVNKPVPAKTTQQSKVPAVAAPPKPKPANKHPLPIVPILLALIITGGLVAAAIYASR